MRIFISYSHQDQAVAQALVSSLHERQHYVWFDLWELRIGDSLIQRIQDGIMDAGAVLVLISSHSVKSKWCQTELEAALTLEIGGRSRFVLPCILDDCELPLFLQNKVHANFKSNPSRAMIDIERALLSLDAGSSVNTTPEPREAFPLHRPRIQVEEISNLDGAIVTARFKNVGNIGAVVYQYFGWPFHGSLPEEPLDYIPVNGEIYLAPGCSTEKLFFSNKSFGPIDPPRNPRQHQIFFYGYVRYRDDFGNHRRYRFCRRWIEPRGLGIFWTNEINSNYEYDVLDRDAAALFL